MGWIGRHPWLGGLGGLAAAMAAVIAIWNWDWFIPPAERLASAQLGRPVHIAHLHVRLARNPVLEADGIVIDNPPDFPAPAEAPGPFARIAKLGVTLNGPAYLHGRAIVVPSIELERPDVQAVALPDGRNNWTFAFKATPSGGAKPKGDTPRIGDLRITDGKLHAIVPKLKADFNVAIQTRPGQGEAPPQLTASANGTYANAPIVGQFVGGAALTLRDKSNPYPVDLRLTNGATHLALQGTVQDPLAFAGTDLKLSLDGRSLSDLYALSGVAIPASPPYRLAGNLSYADRRIRFDNLAGSMGRSDLSGSISADPGAERPQVAANLLSHRLDLADFAGFVGATPNGHVTPPSPRLIPDTKLSLPRLQAADVTLHYKGEHIEGRSVPLDNVVVEMTLRNGEVNASPVAFGVGSGRIASSLVLTPQPNDTLMLRAATEFQRVDVGRLLSATHTFGGAGTIGGNAELVGVGNSFAGILGHGNGGLKLFMTGGDLSALLVDLSGLEFGNALVSALGLPTRTPVRCLISDFVLRDGLLDTRTLLLDTQEANVIGKGSINLRDEAIAYQLRTEAKHFSIGSLPTSINIGGHLKSPSVLPDAGELAVRGGLAVGLGVLLTPLGALLPTIQLGLGENNDCGALIREARQAPTPTSSPTRSPAPAR